MQFVSTRYIIGGETNFFTYDTMNVKNLCPIPNFDGYWISKGTAQIYSQWRAKIGGSRGEKYKGALKQVKRHLVKGYWQVFIGRKNIKVHRAMALTFKPEGYQAGLLVAHHDGNPLNNKIENLYWATDKQNAEDRERHGCTLRGSNSPVSKWAEAGIRQMRLEHSQGVSNKELMAKYQISKSNLCKIINRQLWKHVD